jgi:hypothetical protein
VQVPRIHPVSGPGTNASAQSSLFNFEHALCLLVDPDIRHLFVKRLKLRKLSCYSDLTS